MEVAWLTACLPERFTILGQTLEPFSIGHFMTLRRLNNSFVYEPPAGGSRPTSDPVGRVPTPGIPQLGDLVQSIFVCCHTFEDGQKALQNPGLTKILGDWGAQVGSTISDNSAAGRTEFEDACSWFRKYASHGCVWPEIAEVDDTEGEKRMPGAPFLQRVLLVLQSKLNFTRSEALNMPYAQALLDYFAYWEMEHAIKILNDGEISERDEDAAEGDRVWKLYQEELAKQSAAAAKPAAEPLAKKKRVLTAKIAKPAKRKGKKHAL